MLHSLLMCLEHVQPDLREVISALSSWFVVFFFLTDLDSSIIKGLLSAVLHARSRVQDENNNKKKRVNISSTEGRDHANPVLFKLAKIKERCKYLGG